MQNLKEITNKLMQMLNFHESRVEFDEENKKVSIYINDETINSIKTAELIVWFDRILRLVAKKYDEGPITVDVNGFHHDREKLVAELAKAGAKKSAITKTDVVLPPMNSFERHLVHDEIATRPDLRTESIGEGTNRRVVIKYIG